MDLFFVFNSILLGVGLAMDAFSVSLANGLREPTMRTDRMAAMAGVFAFFQWMMPLIGWVCVHTVVEYFKAFENAIPWIALVLLLFIGIKMIIESVKCEGPVEECAGKASARVLFLQGVATSIDALSVGFTIADYGLLMALEASVIIGVITFIICAVGLKIGRKFGMKLAGKAGILGGIILIGIGLEIFIKGIFF